MTVRCSLRDRTARRAGALAVLLVVAGAAAGCGAGGAAPEDDAAAAPVEAPPEPTPPAAPTLDAEGLARTFGDAVWQVDVDGCSVLSSGSSFAIAPDLFVTNRHVVEFDPFPTLRSRDGAQELEGVVIGMSDEVDLALIRTPEPVDVVLAWAPTDDLSEGQQVIALGYPTPLETFSVAVGTLNAFEVVDGVRVGIVSDESSDYGSSGGPLLTSTGQVAGIVTEFAEEGGRQILGVSLTHDAVRDEIARILADPAELEPDCEGAPVGVVSVAIIDSLEDLCQADEMWACDELVVRADGEDAAAAAFGASCGGRVDTDEWCTDHFGAPEAFTYGDVASLDLLWESCASGTGVWEADCDLLFSLAPVASDYEAFGDTCGSRQEPGDWCERRYD